MHDKTTKVRFRSAGPAAGSTSIVDKKLSYPVSLTASSAQSGEGGQQRSGGGQRASSGGRLLRQSSAPLLDNNSLHPSKVSSDFWTNVTS